MIRATGSRRRAFTIRTREPLKRDRDRLLAVYLRVVKHWESAIPRIMEAYERELVTYTRDAISDLEDAVNQEAGWFTRLFVTLQAGITDWAVELEQWQRGVWRGATLSATGVDLGTMLYAGDVTQTVESVITQNIGLITDVDAQQASRMKDAVFRGLNGRYPARDVAKELQGITGFGRKRALLIASDQLQKATQALDTERMYQAGVTQFEWTHSRKLHPRNWHKARQGKIYDLQTRRAIDGSETIPADDMPGIPVRCGCRKLAHIDFGDDE